jgi:hypothetical protein
MFFEFLGWLAVSLFLICQIYVSTFPQINKKIFFAANTIGALLMIISSWAIGSWMMVLYNIIWVGISSISFIAHIKVRSPISLKVFRYIIFSILIIGAITCLFNQVKSINIIGYGSIIILTSAYLLYSTNQMKRSRYLRYQIIGLFCAAPQMHLDQNIPALTSQTLFITITTLGVIRHYIMVRKKLVTEEPDQLDKSFNIAKA